MNGAKVLLCEEQSESLKKLAAERGQTVTALVHDAVNRYLHQQKIQDSEAVMFRSRTANGGT